MKNFKTLLFALFAVIALTFTACEDDPCADLDCGPNGTCVEDTNLGIAFCDCDAGFTGANCDQVADPCAAIDCGENGTCVEATDGTVSCDCNAGWTGANCDEELVASYLGSYSITDEDCIANMNTDNCGSILDYSYDDAVVIKEQPGVINGVLIENFFDFFLPDVEAVVDGTSIVIPQQNVLWNVTDENDVVTMNNLTVSGSGTYTFGVDGVSDSIVFNYVVRDNSADNDGCVQTCTDIVWTKQ